MNRALNILEKVTPMEVVIKNSSGDIVQWMSTRKFKELVSSQYGLGRSTFLEKCIEEYNKRQPELTAEIVMSGK